MGKRGKIDVQLTCGCGLNWWALTVARRRSSASSSHVSQQGHTRAAGRACNPEARTPALQTMRQGYTNAPILNQSAAPEFLP